MSYRKIEPASAITFKLRRSESPYLTLTMSQVESLRARDKFHAFMDWARARRAAQSIETLRLIEAGFPQD